MRDAPMIAGHYDFLLVSLSVFISIMTGYAVLDLAERVTTTRGGTRLAWLHGGASAIGIGIFTMHYVGMVAFRLPILVLYDWPTVLLSLLVAILASGVALFVVSRPTMGMARTMGGSIIAGGGIAAMHYIGMAAMRLQAMHLFSPGMVVLSVLLAMITCFIGLQLAFAGRQSPDSWSGKKLGSGIIIGAAIPIMHYTGMAAVNFTRQPLFNASLAHAVAPLTPFGMVVIVAAAAVILGQVYTYSAINRRFVRQEGELIERGIQLKTLFDNLTEGIVVLDKRSNIVQVNPAATRILGFPHEPLTRNSAEQILEMYTLDGDLIPVNEWPGIRGLRGEYETNLELEIRSRHTGTSAVLEISTAPIANVAGDPVQLIIVYRDITERKRTDEAYGRLAAIVKSSQDAIIGKDLNGIVTSWNKGAESIFGYAAEEMVGQTIRRLLPVGREDEEDDIMKRIRNGETIHDLESVRKRKDGSLIQVSLVISPILDGKSRIVGASKIARDITERKLLERQLRQSQKMEAIGQLTGGIAHDFNNLLAIVIGNLGLLERSLAGNVQAEKRLKPAQKAAMRGADLTRRMLALASKEDLNPVRMHVEEAVRETIELAGRALGPEIKIVTNFDMSVPPIFVDAASLESALLNLAVNARDAMPKGGTLTFNTQLSEVDESFVPVQTGELKPGTYARISVSDSGHGMSRETLERALEPFFTTKARGKGTGLGLAMVYGFARQSGGTLRLYSEEGYGTTVSLYFPLGGDTEPATSERLLPHFPACTDATVLVVDDEEGLLDIAYSYLTDMGYTALKADNAASALSTLAQYREIALMITDIIMPGGMNGVELAEKALQINPRLKVIYSSGFPADALMQTHRTVITGPLLRKPYHRTEFVSIVNSTLGELTS